MTLKFIIATNVSILKWTILYNHGTTYQTIVIHDVTIFIMLTPVTKQYRFSSTTQTEPMWKIASIVRVVMNRFSLLVKQFSEMCSV
jgi:hypothetical protein